jgi:hypothetical protein
MKIENKSIATKTLNKLGKIGLIVLSWICLSAPQFLAPLNVLADTELPSIQNSDVKLPEWEEISFSSLGSTTESGVYENRALHHCGMI